jgi:hypothetical protein
MPPVRTAVNELGVCLHTCIFYQKNASGHEYYEGDGVNHAWMMEGAWRALIFRAICWDKLITICMGRLEATTRFPYIWAFIEDVASVYRLKAVTFCSSITRPRFP